MKAILVLATLLAAYQVVLRLLKKAHRAPAPPFIAWFLDSPARKALQPPERLIVRSGIAEGMTVLEIGCGSGAHTTTAARTVGRSGMVVALDIQSRMLRQASHKIASLGGDDTQNIALTGASASELPYRESAFDLVYMVTVLQEIPDRFAALAEVARVLKPGGIVAVSELLIDPDYVPKSKTIEELTRAGFLVGSAPGNLMDYTVTARKPRPQATGAHPSSFAGQSAQGAGEDTP
jgi:ubiquinone/menaquinone biosynthesis C-methylase UbiE